MTKVLVFTESKGDFGSIYFDLGKFFHESGNTLNLLDWSLSYTRETFDLAREQYDFIATSASPNEINFLIDAGIPKEKIVAICHSQTEIVLLAQSSQLNLLEEIRGFAVVNEDIYRSCLDLGVKRLPEILEIGIFFERFRSSPSESLSSIGFFNSLEVVNFQGLETKRGGLIQQLASNLNLEFKTFNSAPFQSRASAFREFDCFLNASLQEGSNYYSLEAAASGKLVISTPVGQFARRSSIGAGILAPIESKKFFEFTQSQLKFYIENSSAYRDKCHEIQEATKMWDWSLLSRDWIDYFNCLK